MDGSGQQLVCALRPRFGKHCRTENVVRFADYLTQRFQVILFSCHERTVAASGRDCKRLLLVTSALLGHDQVVSLILARIVNWYCPVVPSVSLIARGFLRRLPQTRKGKQF